MKRNVMWLAIAGLIHGPASAFEWPGQARSAVSISADDGWPSQLQQATILESYGFRGTFYLSAGGLPEVVTYAADWRQVHLRGHEVGNHSYSHWPNGLMATKSWSQVATDVDTMNQWLKTHVFDQAAVDITYAYPQGNYMIGRRITAQSRQVGACEYAALLSTQVKGARILGSGENLPASVGVNRFVISGASLSGSDEAVFEQAKRAIDNGITKGSWTVLVFHSLGDSGDGYSVSATAYNQVLGYMASRRAELWVAPVVQVQKHVLASLPGTDWSCTTKE